MRTGRCNGLNGMKSFMSLIFLGICITLSGQVVEVQPVFPKVNDDVTITFNAAEGNGALFGVTPVYAHTGLITSESQAPGDWKHVQGNWGYGRSESPHDFHWE